MNIAVKIVIQPCPLMISAGITAHRATNASPSISSRKNTYAFAKTISNVTTANLRGRRDASDKGITVPTFARLLETTEYSVSVLYQTSCPGGYDFARK
jgi:hypothetical protein